MLFGPHASAAHVALLRSIEGTVHTKMNYLLTRLLMACQVKLCGPKKKKHFWSFTGKLLCSKHLKWMRASFEKNDIDMALSG